MKPDETASYIADVKEKLRDEMKKEIEKIFKNERDALIERANMFISVAKWSGGALAITFGLLGIKAWTDIKINVEDYFKDKIMAMYRIDDQNSTARKEIDKLIDRAVVNSAYISAKRRGHITESNSRRLNDRDEPELGSGELERLLRLARGPQTEISVFEDIVRVLNVLVTTEERRHFVSSAFSELLAAKPNTDTSWMTNSERKRLAILQGFNKAESIDAAAVEVLSQKNSEQLQIAALDRILKENYKSAIPVILKRIEAETDGKLRFAALRTLAGLKPDDAIIRRFTNDDLMKRQEKSDLLKCIEFAVSIIPKKREILFFEDNEDIARINKIHSELTVPLAVKAIDGGVHLDYNDFGFNKGVTAKILVGRSMYRVAHIGGNIFNKSFISQLLDHVNKESIHKTAKFIQALSVENKNKKMVQFYVNLENNSLLRLADGQEIQASSLSSARVELRINESIKLQNIKNQSQKNNILLTAVWRDKLGNKREGEILEIVDANFDFDLRFNNMNDNESDD